MPKKQTFTDDLLAHTSVDVELLVTYERERTRHTEECHGLHIMVNDDCTLKSFHIRISGEDLLVNGQWDLMPFLTKKQIEDIENSI
jgi:hypothetical protein